MGSSASKPARSAAQAAGRRQYPNQPSSSPSPATTKSQPQRAQPPPPRPSPVSRESKIQAQTQAPAQGPVYHSKEKASTEKSSAIDLDGRDPHFAASLRSLGPVTPSPTFSNSSTFNQPSTSNPNSPTVFPTSTNPALLVLTSRQRITKEAEKEGEEMGKAGFGGRRYLDALTIRQAVVMRDRQGLKEGEIERALRIRGGVLEKLGERGRGGVFGVP